MDQPTSSKPQISHGSVSKALFYHPRGLSVYESTLFYVQNGGASLSYISQSLGPIHEWLSVMSDQLLSDGFAPDGMENMTMSFDRHLIALSKEVDLMNVWEQESLEIHGKVLYLNFSFHNY